MLPMHCVWLGHITLHVCLYGTPARMLEHRRALEYGACEYAEAPKGHAALLRVHLHRLPHLTALLRANRLGIGAP